MSTAVALFVLRKKLLAYYAEVEDFIKQLFPTHVFNIWRSQQTRQVFIISFPTHASWWIARMDRYWIIHVSSNLYTFLLI